MTQPLDPELRRHVLMIFGGRGRVAADRLIEHACIVVRIAPRGA